MKKAIAVLLFVSVVFFTWTKIASAAVLPDLTVDPNTKSLSLKPGEVYTTNFVLTNNTQHNIAVVISFSNFKAPADESGSPAFFNSPTDNPSVYPQSWFSASQKQVTIPPRRNITWPVLITVPFDVTGGGHYGGVEFEDITGKVPVDTQTGVELSGKIAVPILIAVDTNVTESLAVHSFSSDSSFLSYFSLFSNNVWCFFKASCGENFTTEIQNTGNIHEYPRGKIVIYDIFGSDIAEIPVNHSLGAVLPLSIRKYITTMSQKQVTGLGTGYFTAKLSLDYGLSGTIKNLNAQTSFVVINWSVLLVLLVMGVITLLLYVYTRHERNFSKRRVK